MAYDLEEQEQLATLKEWWAKYGNLSTWVVIAGLAAYSGWNGWGYYQRNQAAQASVLFDELQVAANAKDNAKVLRVAGDIESKYGRTAYAALGALSAAKSFFDANDLKGAKAQLEWVLAHGNDEHKNIAAIRLAGVLLDEKAFDEALKALAVATLPQFKADVEDRKGDILAAQNKLEEARGAYKAALEAAGKNNPGRQLMQLKLESIGGSVPEVKA
ncbi:YfgM family protein [Pseudoduganella violaceinigra]|uniref:YfgM family protein n=1 Tax=Pseudoduganella violaceinigra TaxID=246602 RepID=UPI00042510A1|nr:tetratricopeptide repeat protein [Pseudoduganella violaceinigra]